MDNKKKKDRTLGVAVLVIAAFIAVFLMLAFLLPSVTAKARLDDKLDGYREMTEGDIMHIFDPVYREGSFYGDVTAEIAYEDAIGISERIQHVCDGAKYSSTEANAIGNWDVSIILRKEGGGICTVYFTEEEFYVTKDEKQYRFKPANDKTESYSELFDIIEQRISESSKNME